MKTVVGMAVLAAGFGLMASPPAFAEPSWTMPDLIGMDLQGARTRFSP